jgi:hypothetical protein
MKTCWTLLFGNNNKKAFERKKKFFPSTAPKLDSQKSNHFCSCSDRDYQLSVKEANEILVKLETERIEHDKTRKLVDNEIDKYNKLHNEFKSMETHLEQSQT